MRHGMAFDRHGCRKRLLPPGHETPAAARQGQRWRCSTRTISARSPRSWRGSDHQIDETEAVGGNGDRS